ncbi:hypothetical protein [Flavobacterium notoginsengisoli]|uniref:hypothetical protein n=1 Tax=Flavobacterium notoginsengisoli TaxID=1478199 RepID=UPI00362FB04F
MALQAKGIFYKKLNDNEIIDLDITIDYEIILDQSVINWNRRTIKGIIFKEKVLIKDAEINFGFLFIDCRFEKGIRFNNVKASGFDGAYKYSIEFENCHSASFVIENKSILTRNIFINKCQIEKIIISETAADNDAIAIHDSTVSFLHILNSKSNLNLRQSVFNKQVRFDSIAGDFSFYGNEFNKDIEFWDIECYSSFSSIHNVYKEEFEISASRIKKLSLFGDHFLKKSELENRDISVRSAEPVKSFIKEIYISETNFTQGFDFNGLGEKLERLEIKSNPELKGVLKFEGWEIDNVLITGVNQNLKLLFKRVSFRFFVINDFTNYTDISFDKCRGYDGSTLNLSDCDLGSTRFNEFDFNSFVELRFDNVTLDKIRPANNRWFDDVKLKIEVAGQTVEERFKRKREVYKQLKHALKNNGNQIDSLFFQAREMQAYRDELRHSRKYGNGDKIIMTFSKFNDYGLNWIKPVKIVLIVTFLLYLLILPGISDKILFSFSCDADDLKNTYEIFIANFKVLWSLFNPARRTDLAYGKTIQTDWIYFLDLLHRIFLAVMIFQIIKAFRKHVSS